MASNRVARGRRTQALVTEWFREHGWSGAENTPASLPGKDVTGMIGYAPEVKATTRNGSLTGALKQAKKNAAEGETPFVVWRPDGYGEERMGEWVVAITLADFTWLMRQLKGFRDEAELDHDPFYVEPTEQEQIDLLWQRVEALEQRVVLDLTSREVAS